MSTDLKLSKAHKIIQSGGFLVSLLSKLAGPLMKVVTPLAKNVLALLGITAAASVIDTGIQKKKKHGSGTTILIISNEEINDIMKIVQGASLVGNLLAGKGILRAGSGNKKGKGIVRAGTGRPASSASQKQ